MDLAAHGSWLWSADPAGRPARGLARLRRAAPTDVLLEPQERIFLRDGMRGRGTALGTDRAAIICAAGGGRRRVAWTDVAEAGWSAASGLTVLSLWPVRGDRPERIELPTSRVFAIFAAERVAASQVLRRRVQLTATMSGTVVAIRGARHAEVTWRVLLDAGRDDDPQLAAAATRAVADLRRLAGC